MQASNHEMRCVRIYTAHAIWRNTSLQPRAGIAEVGPDATTQWNHIRTIGRWHTLVPAVIKLIWAHETADVVCPHKVVVHDSLKILVPAHPIHLPHLPNTPVDQLQVKAAGDVLGHHEMMVHVGLHTNAL